MNISIVKYEKGPISKSVYGTKLKRKLDTICIRIREEDSDYEVTEVLRG